MRNSLKTCLLVLACQIGFVILFGRPIAGAAIMVRGFPLQLKGTVDTGGPVAFDLDDDGRTELLLGTARLVEAVESDGSSMLGFPVEYKPGMSIVTPLTVGHLGPVRKLGIFFGTEDKRLHALDGSGKAWEGFPVLLSGVLSGPPTLFDWDSDGGSELIFSTQDGKIVVLDASGKMLNGFPAGVGSPVSTAVTAGVFRSGGPKILLFGDEQGAFHAWTGPRQELKGFPTQTQFALSSQAALGDIDDDGSFEAVIGSKDFKVYVIRENGTLAEGFPVATGYRIYSSCALADIDGDGIHDIVVTSGDGKLYAFSKGGRSLPGFPVKLGTRLRASPVVGDVDFDGFPEIAVGSDQSQLVLVRNSGKQYAGFPIRMPDRVEVAPLLADLDGDGLIEVVAVSQNGVLSAFRMIRKGKIVRPLAWPMEGQNASRRAVTYPNPPRYAELTLQPANPKTTDGLRLGYRFFDLDGDPEPNPLIRWFRNGKPVAELDGLKEVPATITKKHERWHFTIQADPTSSVFTGPTVQIENTAPEPPQITILPKIARTDDDLELKFVLESKDEDQDKIHYRIQWTRDRELVKELNGSKVPAKLSSKGQLWTVMVTPSDGESQGGAAQASIVISNSPPLAPKVRLEPQQPKVSQDLRVVIEQPGRDSDGDPVSYRYWWQLEGTTLDVSPDSPLLPGGFSKKHKKVRVEVTSFDGQELGGKGQAEVEFINTPPLPPVVQISPPKPRTIDDLSVDLVKGATDPDYDSLRYEVLWRREGRPYKGPHAQELILPSSETQKGERWTVVVTPYDEDSKGTPAEAQVVIGNTKPPAVELTAVNPRPKTTENLALQIVKPPTDADGDPVEIEVVWTQGSQELARGKGLLSLSSSLTVKHNIYLAKVIPWDGQDKGPERSQGFEVINSPPGQCQVRIEPAAPGTGEELRAVWAGGANDSDGDKVELRYRWYQDGKPHKSDSGSDRVSGRDVAKGQHWTVVATPFDGEDQGPPCDASVLVVNRPPSLPQISLEPPQPRALDSLRCNLLEKAKDPDGDEVSLRYAWSVDGKPYPSGEGTGVLAPGSLKKGQRWQLTVVASDGELESKPATSSAVVVQNTPPGDPQVEISPKEPDTDDDLLCHLSGPTPDVDGDALGHSFEWFLAKDKPGQITGNPIQTGPAVSRDKTQKGQIWICRVRAQDGEAQGGEAIAKIQIQNAAPTTPEVEIEPATPVNGQNLTCALRKEATDPDGDSIRYRFRWTKEGVLQSFAPETDMVPARLIKAKEIWQCEVSATDGFHEGPMAKSQRVVVRAR